MSSFTRRLLLRASRRFGAAGIAGGALALAALALAAWLPGLQRDAQEAARAAADAARLARLQPSARSGAAAPADALRGFVTGFPPVAQNAADLAQVFEAAQTHHLALPKGEYELKADSAGALVTYSATFPVHGDYQALKDFSADVLATLPHAAMDELRISRDSAASPALDALVRFTFFYRRR